MLGTNPTDSIIYDPTVADDSLILDISALTEAFFKGMDKFLDSISNNKSKFNIIKKRLNKLFKFLPQ